MQQSHEEGRGGGAGAGGVGAEVDETPERLTRPGGGRPFTKEDAKAIVEKHDRRHEGPPHESRRGIVREKDGKLDYAEFSRALVVDMTLRADVDDAFVEGKL